MSRVEVDTARLPLLLGELRLPAIASGDAWLAKGDNLLLFGPPGSGKTHIAAAIGRALIENGYRVLFTRTTGLVQRLQAARQQLILEAAITKLDRYDLLVLDDLSYVRKDQAETSVLFELIARRYERRSMLITAKHAPRQSSATISAKTRPKPTATHQPQTCRLSATINRDNHLSQAHRITILIDARSPSRLSRYKLPCRSFGMRSCKAPSRASSVRSR